MIRLVCISGILLMIVLAVYIFRHGMRSGENGSDKLMRPACMNCKSAAFCNDIQRFEHLATVTTRPKCGEAVNTFPEVQDEGT